MAESKHTPGPWSVPHFARPDVNCECGYVLTDHLMGAVATVHASGKGDDWAKHGDNPKFHEAVANAYLIAAAPDLLEALKHAEEWLAGWASAETELAFIRAAIAKAEGPTLSQTPVVEEGNG